MISFLFLLLCQYANAQLLKNDTHLSVENIEVVERRDQFSLEIRFKKTEKKNLLLNLFDYGKKNGEPATIDIDENLAKAVIKISPEIPFTLSPLPQGVILVGNFLPQTDYTINISDQLKDKSGISLRANYSRTIHIEDYKPQFSFLNKSRFIPPHLQENIAFETINLNEVEISIRQIYTQNIHQLLSSHDSVNDNLSDIIKTDTITIKNHKNKKIKGSFSLENLRPIGQGIFYLEALSNKLKLDSNIVVITELGAILKLGEDQILRIWTIKNTNLKPLQNVEVTLNSESNFKMGQCYTKGSNGYCEIKWTNKNRVPFAITLKKGIDQSYLRLSDLLLSSEEFDKGKRNYFLKNQSNDAFIYSARNLYRAGETIHLAAQVRTLKFEGIKDLSLTWKFFSPDGIQYKEFTTKSSNFGIAHMDLPTNLLNPNGIYTVRLFTGKTLLDSSRFRIESYSPERLIVKLIPEKKIVIEKRKIKFDIQANHLMGSQPVTAQFTASCALEEAFHSIPNHPEYKTGTYTPNGQNPVTVDTVSGVINKGENNFYFCDFTRLLDNLPKTVYKVISKASVAELSSSNQIHESANLIFSSKNSNLGIKAQQNPENNSVNIEGQIFDLDGNVQNENHKIKVELLQIQENWISIQHENASNWKLIETINPKSISKTLEAKDGAFQVKLIPPLEWRKWIVRATDLQTKMITELPLDSLLSTSETAHFEHIDIKVNKTGLQTGEKFKVTLIPPFKGELIVGLESFKIIEQKWIHIDKTQAIELEFKTPDVSPNFYITALLLKEPISKNNRLITNRAWAAKSIQVIPKKNTLNIQIATPTVINSLSELQIKISNSEKTESEYSVALVDEELLAASEFQLPNPLQHFFDSRKLNAKTFESLNSLTNKTQSEESITTEKDILGSINKHNQHLVHFWYPLIKSDKKGKAELKVKIPNFIGKFKLFIVGSAHHLMGSHESAIEVRDNLNIQTQNPSFFTVNDKTNFNLKLTNLTKSDIPITVNIGTLGPLQLEKTQFSETVKASTVSQLSSIAQVLDYPQPISIDISSGSIEISSGSLKSDKNWQEKIVVPTYTNGVEQYLQFDTSVDDKLDLITALPPIWKKNFLKIHLSLSNIPFIGAFSHLSKLWNYPYGNLEQTVSKILPLISNNDLLGLSEGLDPKIIAPEVHDKIQNTLDKIVSQQTLDGGFAFWPSENTSHPWATAYATLALTEANLSNYLISTYAFNKALNYLQKLVEASAPQWQWYENENPELSLALYVLAKNKKNISKELKAISINMSRLNQKISEAFGYENLFLLAATAKLTGENELLNKIIGNKTFAKKLFSQNFLEKSFSTKSFWSSIRMDGLRLNMLLEHWPEHPAIITLIQRLTHTLSQPKSFFSSQDLSWSLFALSNRLRNFKIDPQLQKNIELQFNGKKFKAHFYVRGIPVWYFSGDELLSSSFQFPELEKTKLTFHTKVSGFTMGPPPSLSPITVERAYLLPNGDEADETELKIGDQVIVELRIFNPRSIRFRSVALIDRIPTGFSIDSPRANSEASPWMNKKILHADYYDIIENQLQIFGEITETERFYYYQVRATYPGKFKAPSAKVELMYIPESFDFSSEAAIGVTQ
jgi:uncharacterized protein YfaS (alpha-2-macroglobulin family)